MNSRLFSSLWFNLHHLINIYKLSFLVSWVLKSWKLLILLFQKNSRKIKVSSGTVFCDSVYFSLIIFPSYESKWCMLNLCICISLRSWRLCDLRQHDNLPVTWSTVLCSLYCSKRFRLVDELCLPLLQTHQHLAEGHSSFLDAHNRFVISFDNQQNYQRRSVKYVLRSFDIIW